LGISREIQQQLISWDSSDFIFNNKLCKASSSLHNVLKFRPAMSDQGLNADWRLNQKITQRMRACVKVDMEPVLMLCRFRQRKAWWAYSSAYSSCCIEAHEWWQLTYPCRSSCGCIRMRRMHPVTAKTSSSPILLMACVPIPSYRVVKM
jgi:hypothetical protein